MVVLAGRSSSKRKTRKARVGRIGAGLALACVATVGLAPTADALPPVTRVAGADRYATAAAVSSSAFSPGVDVAIVATGTNFPDALAAGPVGAKLAGPVLLVNETGIPGPTATELDRLDPDRILVVGGPNAVADSILTALQQYTAGTVSRVSGPDRYATAAMLSAGSFAPGVPVVYLATGANFPDALAAGAAAGAQGGPVLLTGPTALPNETAAELDRLNPGTIVIPGGTVAVSATIDMLVAGYGTVVRRVGADRYDTAVAVSSHAFGTSVPKVFVATGKNFPDALAAGPVAGLVKGPVLLVPGVCIPPGTDAEVARTNATSSTIVGGEAAVSAAVAAGQICVPQQTPVTFGDGTHVIGSGIPAGTYRTRADVANCYWERLSGFSGELDDIIANNFDDSHQVVTIAPTDAGFGSEDCGTWTNDLSPLTQSRVAPFGDGTWIVKTDIDPGTWGAPGGGGCYWERLSGFSGELDDIVTNDFGTTNPVVTIADSDVGFGTSGCGTWTRL